MRYYYRYAVMYIDANNQLKSKLITADNSKHLDERITESLGDVEVLSQVCVDGIFISSSGKTKKSIKINEDDEAVMFIKSFTRDELIGSKVRDIYDEYENYCISNELVPDCKMVFSKKLQQIHGLTVHVIKNKDKSCRVYN